MTHRVDLLVNFTIRMILQKPRTGVREFFNLDIHVMKLRVCEYFAIGRGYRIRATH